MDTRYSQQYDEDLGRHYSAFWGPRTTRHVWARGSALPQECSVLEYAPLHDIGCWVYATCGMTLHTEARALELFLLSPYQTEGHVELLTAIGHYHQTDARLGLGHTVSFGRPWFEGSRCSFGLVSLPYTFGPELEIACIQQKHVRVLWLLPITEEERAFKMASGLEALEGLFEERQFNYLDPQRVSVVGTARPSP
ncbi:MAG TPA: suppressor of fused domain protein [Chloroflexota bacterium]|nr:suppressor of fused domain protein [Chloroflexota bacterium]